MSKDNGNNIEVELKENVDYFEMKDGVWYTIEGAAKKYGIATTTVSWKGNQFDIPKKKIAGSVCYKEDERFNYQRATAKNAEHLPKNPSYSELVHRFTDSIERFDNWKSIDGQWKDAYDYKLNEINNKLDMILDYLTKDKGVSNE